MKHYFVLAHSVARQSAIAAIHEAPDGYVVTISEPKRNLDQNAYLHAAISDVAKKVPWAGRLRDVETWKRLLTASWLRARGESIELLPAVDGHGVDVVFRHTSKLTKSEFSELIEYINSWKAENVTEAA
jgi:hypothetical protein